MNVRSAFTSRTSAKLSIQPVLEQGLIISATAYSDGTRVVTFEDPSTEVDSRKDIHIGRAKDFTNAFVEALNGFYYPGNASRTVRIHTRPSYIQKLDAKVDRWIMKHKGSLKAMAEEDGSVLVNLEGFQNPYDPRTRILLQGKGQTFYNALLDATDQYRKHDPRVKSIRISQQ